uniref:Alpha-1,3-mannosyl-glycoprotein 2-beta-N-acetylglucosaminyltransferase n=1 Tax=Angiostrongylus cantonensis TaxID=6313 RepID=A0A0K0DK14_ANGCA
LFDERNVKNGVNLVSLNGFTGEIESRGSFDVATSDGELIGWLRSLPQSSIIAGVSFGDVAERVSADTRALFASFGAVRIADWRESSSYAILGQADKIANALVFDPAYSMREGCLKLYVRIDVEKMAALGGSMSGDRVVHLGAEWKGCGIPEKCGFDEIPMHFFTGEHKDDWPRLCVGGRMVLDRGLNGAGRGLNLVSIEPKTGRVSSVAHFDTYQDGTRLLTKIYWFEKVVTVEPYFESTALEQWLDNLPLGEVLAVVSFDEASTMLSDMAKQIFYEMGSSMVQRLKFRASWYFVGHRELAAYSPFEDLNIPSGNSWAKPIKTSICLPKKLDSWRGRASDVYLRPHNLPRRHFCLKHDRHGDFCSESSVDNPIRPRALSDPKRKGDPVFNMPIVLAAGLSTDSLRICLESLMEQEGLNTQMVVVVYDKEYPENAELSSLFHVKSVPVNSTNGYNSLLLSAVSAAFYLFPTSPAVAVIEEDVRLSPDWLFYLSQTLPVLLKDKTIDVVQTFNPNGYVDTGTDPSLVYRIDHQPPLYSYVLTRNKYENDIKENAGITNHSFKQLTSKRLRTKRC